MSVILGRNMSMSRTSMDDQRNGGRNSATIDSLSFTSRSEAPRKKKISLSDNFFPAINIL